MDPILRWRRFIDVIVAMLCGCVSTIAHGARWKYRMGTDDRIDDPHSASTETRLATSEVRMRRPSQRSYDRNGSTVGFKWGDRRTQSPNRTVVGKMRSGVGSSAGHPAGRINLHPFSWWWLSAMLLQLTFSARTEIKRGLSQIISIKGSDPLSAC